MKVFLRRGETGVCIEGEEKKKYSSDWMMRGGFTVRSYWGLTQTGERGELNPFRGEGES